MNNTNGQANQLTEAFNIMQTLINGAIKGGLFNNAESVMQCQAANNYLKAEIKRLQTEVEELRKKETV